MPQKVTPESAKGKILLPLGVDMEVKLRAVAQSEKVTAATLLRWAAEAIIRVHAERGHVPRPMRIAGVVNPRDLVDRLSPRALQFIEEYETIHGPGSFPPQKPGQDPWDAARPRDPSVNEEAPPEAR